MVKTSKPKEKKETPEQPWRILWPGDRGATTGDLDRDTLHTAVGFSLSKWEELEDDLAKLFCEMIGARWGEPAVRAYGAVANSRSRIDMLEEAAEAFFYYATFRKKATGPDKAIVDTERKFKNFIKHCRGLASRRNDIAHGRTQSHPELGYFLRPPNYSSRKITFDAPFGAYSYTSVEISIYTNHFEQLIQSCIALRSAVESIAKKIS